MSERRAFRRIPASHPDRPAYIRHDAFSRPDAERRFGCDPDCDYLAQGLDYMPDKESRDRTARMHYAAYRADRATSSRIARSWLNRYYSMRDSIVLGNMKLIFKAVRRSSAAEQCDDWIGECQIVLIKSVAAYNPWFGVRFSTYAYTSLARHLCHLSRRCATDRLAKALSLDAAIERAPESQPTASSVLGLSRIDEFFRPEHPLLSSREKAILTRRYYSREALPVPTLEDIGRDMGLSKERVRQLQAEALTKLRGVLS